MVERIISTKINKEHYTADACIVWCFDDRFSCLLGSFVRNANYDRIDLVNIAGGAKGLASPADDHERAYVLDQIEKSIRLHHAPQVVLMVHSECGAYGKSFSDADAEQSFYCNELHSAQNTVREFLSQKYSDVQVLKYYADFDGLVKVS